VKAAVLGKPIAHSRSPVLHNAAYPALGLTGWSYTSIECDEDELPDLVKNLGPDWAGLSLTRPLKRAVLPLLDVADSLVTAVGGANTVIFRPDGRYGYNTDVYGMVAALAEVGVSTASSATVLGGGATACAALAALRELGLTSVMVLARAPERAGGLLTAAGRLGIAVELRPLPAGTGSGGQRPVTAGIQAGGLLISTLPAGAFETERQWPELSELLAVLDVVYNPWPTSLAAAASAAGVPVASGFDMLLHQAARQVELMTGCRPAPVEAMRTALRAASGRV